MSGVSCAANNDKGWQAFGELSDRIDVHAELKDALALLQKHAEEASGDGIDHRALSGLQNPAEAGCAPARGRCVRNAVFQMPALRQGRASRGGLRSGVRGRLSRSP